MLTNADIMRNAYAQGTVIPAFNIAHLPMTGALIRAAVDQDSFAFIAVSRIDWMKFGAESLAAVAQEFARHSDPDHIRLHLDHVPVIDEDGLRVDYPPIFREALTLGYGSVMIDGSRLPLEENIAATREVSEMAHQAGVPCEAELGAVMGHEAGPLPPYEELFASGKGFTDPAEAERFVRETGCDWLSVAVGSIHGAISGAARDQKKVEARLNLEHLEKLRAATGIPLVLHGGSGVKQEAVLAAIKLGIAKVNVGTEIRQVFESSQRETGSLHGAQEALYERTAWFIRDYFHVEGSRGRVCPA